MAAVLRFLVVLFFLRLLFRFLAAVVRGYLGAGSPPAARVGTQDLVRDHVCNTFVPRDRALHLQRAGREEHFCSPACRDRALAAGV